MLPCRRSLHCLRTFESRISLYSQVFTRLPKLLKTFLTDMQGAYHGVSPRLFLPLDAVIDTHVQVQQPPPQKNTVSINFPACVVVSVYSF